MKDEAGELTLWTRRKTLITDPLPELRAALDAMISNDSIIDGVLLDKRTQDVKQHYYAFDVIRLNGEMLYWETWTERRRRLEIIYQRHDLIELAQTYDIGKQALFYRSIEADEGIVMKKRDAAYPTGTRNCLFNQFWITVKRDEAHRGRFL